MELLVKALIKAKKEFGPISKDRVNPHFKSRYATLDAILAVVEPGLHANGLVVVQVLSKEDGATLVTHLIHESGQQLTSSYPLPDITDPQKFGAAITYARRYALCAILSVTADEDDDGNAASQPKGKSAPQSPRDAALAKILEFKEGGHGDLVKKIAKERFNKTKPPEFSDEELTHLVDLVSEAIGKPKQESDW
jgi:ERF superfamily